MYGPDLLEACSEEIIFLPVEGIIASPPQKKKIFEMNYLKLAV